MTAKGWKCWNHLRVFNVLNGAQRLNGLNDWNELLLIERLQRFGFEIKLIPFFSSTGTTGTSRTIGTGFQWPCRGALRSFADECRFTPKVAIHRSKISFQRLKASPR